MNRPLTPHYIDLVQDACLKSFWTKNALQAFLRNCRVEIPFLGPDETKRQFLFRLFDKLPRSESGRAAILRMASCLCEQQSFPDLENWEDTKEKIGRASRALELLREYSAKRASEAESVADRERTLMKFRERQALVADSQANLTKLATRLDALGRRLGEQDAGYEFQEWFFDLLEFFEVSYRRPYVHGGRQIDGSFTMKETTYLVELKFTTGQAAAPDIDTFFRKVMAKADNTMGVMVSISGYSSVAVHEASAERTPILLMDHEHIYAVLTGMMGFPQLIERLRRHASQTGEAYLPVGRFGG